MSPTISYSFEELMNVVKAAQNFLLYSRTKKGWWKDFFTYAGFSDEWVSAYVASILSKSSDEKLLGAAHRVWDLLMQRRRFRPKKAWGFNRWTPSDADTTGWVLNLYLNIGVKNPKIYQEGISFLQKHLGENGGFTTYHNKNVLKRFTRLYKNYSFEGWCSVHPCVTTTLSTIPEFRRKALVYLLDAQEKEGSWPGYWWVNKEYATYLAIGAICNQEDIYKQHVFSSAKNWAINRTLQLLCQHSKFESFALANSLGILALDNEKKPEIVQLLSSGIRTLFSNQLPDGSWPSSARLRIPPPDIVKPDEYSYWFIEGKGGGSILTDKNRIFTTATVVRFLTSVHTNHLFV